MTSTVSRIRSYTDWLPDGPYAVVVGITTFSVVVPIYLLLGVQGALIMGHGVALGGGLGAPSRRKRGAWWRKLIAARFAKSS